MGFRSETLFNRACNLIFCLSWDGGRTLEKRLHHHRGGQVVDMIKMYNWTWFNSRLYKHLKV